MCREYAYQSSLGGIFDKLVPLVILTSNLRGCLSVQMQIQDHRHLHLEAIRVGVDALGVDQVQAGGKNPLTVVEQRLLDRIVLGTSLSLFSLSVLVFINIF
jgi:hypothetical protein